MERPLTAFVALAAALCIGSSALAQRSVDGTAPSAQPAQVSDQELQTFAKIYVDLQESVTRHEAQLAAAQNEKEAKDVQADFEKESVATMSKHGWTLDKYNTVVKSINADPALAERAKAMIAQ